MNKLSKLIEIFSENRNIHICITDLIGALKNIDIPKENAIHSMPFCNIAKSTNSGYNLCLRCKNACNLLCIRHKKPFWGYCVFGLYELCYPVVYNNKTICIIYIGNFLKDKNITSEKIQSVYSKTNCDTILLEKELNNAEILLNNEEKFLLIAKILEEELLKIFSTSEYNITDCRYAVEMAKNMANKNFNEQLILKNIAKSVYVNEKYLGRLFIKETGKSFNTYLNDIRIINAEKLLKTTNKTITEIAYETGFNSASYFNKSFLKRFGITPNSYRKKN